MSLGTTDKIEEREIIYRTLRTYSKTLQITILGEIPLQDGDKQLLMINESLVLSGKLFEKFPNVPRTAKYIGLGQGEIMQISVPFGSPYAYLRIPARALPSVFCRLNSIFNLFLLHFRETLGEVMRKVLLILDGIVAKEFLSILVARHLDKNAYIFVSQIGRAHV